MIIELEHLINFKKTQISVSFVSAPKRRPLWTDLEHFDAAFTHHDPWLLAQDVHERFRTESHFLATGRFNERFLLSLASCGSCIVMDDELNVLPISSHVKSITPVPVDEDSEGLSEAQRDLKDLKEQLKDDFPVGPLIKKCCTLDQGKAVITFLDAILDKTLHSTVALLAGRGRGKSAALGLAIAAGYSNIFVTAPSPENLKTLFEFVLKGFDMLKYKEHLDYDVVKSSNPELKKVVMRINIYKQHRQTIQVGFVTGICCTCFLIRCVMILWPSSGWIMIPTTAQTPLKISSQPAADVAVPRQDCSQAVLPFTDPYCTSVNIRCAQPSVLYGLPDNNS